MQIQCGRYTSFNFPAITAMSIRGPAGMYWSISILSIGSSQEQNWYLKLTFSLQTQRKPETLHSKFPASDSRLHRGKENKWDCVYAQKYFIKGTKELILILRVSALSLFGAKYIAL